MSNRLIHAVRFVGGNSSGLCFCASARAAKTLARRYDLKNPKCVRAAKHFDRAPEVVTFPAETPVLEIHWTSGYDGGGHDYHGTTHTVAEVLAEVVHLPEKVPAATVQRIADQKDLGGVKILVDKKWKSYVEIKYRGTVGECVQAQRLSSAQAT